MLAAGAGVLGSVISLFWEPTSNIRSAIQHFAAGAILAAIASNVITEVEKIGTFAGIIGGFLAGGLVMVALKWMVVRYEYGGKNKNKIPVGLAAAAAVDTLIDGIITGAGFSTSQQLGSLLAIALAIELLFLPLSVGVEFRKEKFTGW